VLLIVARIFLRDALVSEPEWPGMMPAGSVVVEVVKRRSGAETRRGVQTLVFVCHYERRKTRNRAVLSLWTLKYGASRWVHNGGYGMAKDVEMRIWRHSSKGQVA
jgi:hypothetical protein